MVSEKFYIQGRKENDPYVDDNVKLCEPNDDNQRDWVIGYRYGHLSGIQVGPNGFTILKLISWEPTHSHSWQDLNRSFGGFTH